MNSSLLSSPSSLISIALNAAMAPVKSKSSSIWPILINSSIVRTPSLFLEKLKEIVSYFSYFYVKVILSFPRQDWRKCRKHCSNALVSVLLFLVPSCSYWLWIRPWNLLKKLQDHFRMASRSFWFCWTYVCNSIPFRGQNSFGAKQTIGFVGNNWAK